MVPLLLLLPLLWWGSQQEQPGYELRVQELVRVQEGLYVYVPCSFYYPWSSWYSPDLYTYWYWSGNNRGHDKLVATNNKKKTVSIDNKRRFLLEDPVTNNECSLTIKDARKSDSGTYIFRVERGSTVQYTYQDKKLTLQVTDKPDIQIQEPLESGHPTQLTCSLPGSCKEGSPLTFSWLGLAVDSIYHRSTYSVLTFTPRPQHHGTHLTCQVKCQGSKMTTQRTIWLNVSYAPQSLSIAVSFRNVTALKILQNPASLSILEGESLRLICVADSNPPAQMSWFRGSPARNAAPISHTAILELPRVGIEKGQFTCQARHPLGSQNILLHLSVVYPPQLLGPFCSWEDEALNCSCSSRAQPTSSVQWRLGDRLLEGSPSNTSHTITSSSTGPWANSSLSLHSGLRVGLRLSCQAENVHGAQSATVLLLPGQLVTVVSKAGLVPAALGSAGAVALLSIVLCLTSFCIVKNLRKQAAGRPKVTNDEDPVMITIIRGSQENPRPDECPDQMSPMGDASLSREEQDTHYANLSFHGRKMQKPQNKSNSSCEYAEVKKTSKERLP